MATKSTLLNYVKNSTTSIIDERYRLDLSAGSDTFILGDVKRAFIETGFAIEEGDSNGTVLTKGVDYDFTEKDSYYTSEEGENVWTKVQILNAAYYNSVIYITYEALHTYTDADFFNDLRSDVDNLQTSVLARNVLTKTADYTITDDDLTGYSDLIIFVNPSSGNVTITLPTLADNQEKKISVQCTDLGGKITIDGEGAETIGSYSELVLQSKNDSLDIIAESGEWQILKYRAKYDTGWQNRFTYANVHMGTSAFDFDNRSGAFTIGEEITETATGNTGIIQSMTDAASGTIYVKNVTGTGIWTNNNEIVGSTSGQTCDVNEAAGNNKDQDTNVLHDFGFDVWNIGLPRVFVSTDKTQANTYDLSITTSNSSYGMQILGIDSSNFQIQTSDSGSLYINSATGGWIALNGLDWYYRVIVEVKI